MENLAPGWQEQLLLCLNAEENRRVGGKNVRAFETSTREEDATDYRSPLSSGLEAVAGRVRLPVTETKKC